MRTPFPQALTHQQKLQALADRFYNRTENPWQPKAGDYYTSCRADLELYQIVAENATHFFTVYCDKSKYGNAQTITPSQWPKVTFLHDFGRNRVHVPTYIFNIE